MFLVWVVLITGTFGLPTKTNEDPPPVILISREKWGARPSTEVTPLVLPVPYVVIHHSSEPPACTTFDQCQEAMRWMQDYHQLTNGWADIGYNFAVGGDGLVYEGRGWERVGAHAPVYNFYSIGIVMIGHWVSELPPQRQVDATKNLIELGLELGYINANYSLIGHRQVRHTECPGTALYTEISSWNHFDPTVAFEETNRLEKWSI